MKRPFQQIVLCTHNEGKRREIKKLLSDLPLEILTSNDFPDLPDPIEDGDSFLENARIKAQVAYQHTGLPSLADDSGLVVPSLNGEPGIYSARYAGVIGQDRDRKNREFLRQKLKKIPTQERNAAFHCTLVFQISETKEVHFTGTCEGLLIDEERGDQGFGYDPMFLIPELDQTFAEITQVEKSKRSHRGHALTQFVTWMRSL